MYTSLFCPSLLFIVIIILFVVWGYSSVSFVFTLRDEGHFVTANSFLSSLETWYLSTRFSLEIQSPKLGALRFFI